MDQFDMKLLSVLQARVPLVREPFAQIARELGCGEKDVLAAVASLRSEGAIREISGVFDAAAMGYSKSLVAFRLPADSLDAAGDIVSGHPGVSHCYGRTGRYNLWFTLAVSPGSSLGLAATAALLAEKCRCEAHLLLPSTKQYKLHVHLPGGENETPLPAGGGRVARAPQPSAEQVAAVRALQTDLPSRSDPFASLAEDPDMLLVHAADFMSAGWLRRYAASVAHRKAGLEANVMVAWEVAAEKADAAGAACSELQAVSHCYLRPAGKDWPYTLYTMIHGRNERECTAAIEKIAAATGIRNRAELATLKEYKKRRVRLFDASEREWEKRNAKNA